LALIEEAQVQKKNVLVVIDNFIACSYKFWVGKKLRRLFSVILKKYGHFELIFHFDFFLKDRVFVSFPQ
jgi:hypothetical protein